MCLEGCSKDTFNEVLHMRWFLKMYRIKSVYIIEAACVYCSVNVSRMVLPLVILYINHAGLIASLRNISPHSF
jgi:hypothetical protein